MRTKALLGLAALAIAIPASAQVYSANVVGYVNQTLQGSFAFNMIANPLKASNNDIASLFPSVPDGSQIYRWDAPNFDLSGTINTFGSGVWDSTFTLNPGEAIFFANPGDAFTVTYVGEVIQGNYTNNLLGSFAFNMVGSSAPLGGSFTNAIAGIVPNDGDQIYTWDVANFDLAGTIATYGSGVWDVDFPIAVGEGFFYVNVGSDQEWVRNFTVPTP